MSKIQWEYDLVERPFCQQLKGMGWQWIEGDKDVPEFTERQNFGEVLLKGRLAAAPSMMSGLALSESSQPRDRARRGEQRAIRLDAAAPGERSRFPPRLRLREAPDAPLESQDAKPVEMRSPGDLIAVTTPVNSMSASTACAGFMPSVSFTRSEWRCYVGCHGDAKRLESRMFVRSFASVSAWTRIACIRLSLAPTHFVVAAKCRLVVSLTSRPSRNATVLSGPVGSPPESFARRRPNHSSNEGQSSGARLSRMAAAIAS